MTIGAESAAVPGTSPSTPGTTYNIGGITTSFTTTIPSDVAAGQILILPVLNRDSTSAPSVTDNDTGGNAWAVLQDGNNGTAYAGIYWKRATSGTASKTITVSGMTGSSCGGVRAFSGCLASGNPYENSSYETNASNNETHAGFTPSEDNCRVFLVVFNATNDITANPGSTTDPGALSYDVSVRSTGGNDCELEMQSANQTTAAATGNFTWSQTNAASMSIVFALRPAAAGISEAIGQVTETDTAQAIAVNPLRRLLAQATETDTAQAFTIRRVYALGQVTETDTAQTMTPGLPKIVSLSQVTETDIAQAIALNPYRRLIQQALETDTSQGLTKAKAKAITQVIETDLAQAFAAIKRLAIGQTTETDIAQSMAVSGNIIVSLDMATELDTAQAFFSKKLLAVGQVLETDTAQAFVVAKRTTIGQATESDSAQAFAWLLRRLLGQAIEVDSALSIALFGEQVVIIGLANEADSALAMTVIKLFEGWTADAVPGASIWTEDGSAGGVWTEDSPPAPVTYH